MAVGLVVEQPRPWLRVLQSMVSSFPPFSSHPHPVDGLVGFPPVVGYWRVYIWIEMDTFSSFLWKQDIILILDRDSNSWLLYTRMIGAGATGSRLCLLLVVSFCACSTGPLAQCMLVVFSYRHIARFLACWPWCLDVVGKGLNQRTGNNEYTYYSALSEDVPKK